MTDSEFSFRIDAGLSIEFHLKWGHGDRLRDSSALFALYRVPITLLQVPREITLPRTWPYR